MLRQLAEELLLEKERAEGDEDSVLKGVESKGKQIAAASRLVQHRIEASAAVYERLLRGDADAANAVRTSIFLEAHTAVERVEKAVALLCPVLQLAGLK